MGIKIRIKRPERAAEEEMLVIPQRDGTVKSFPQSAGVDAYMNLMERLGAGGDASPEHPLIEAARDSSDAKWSRSFFAVNDPEEWTAPIENLRGGRG